jgi:hypothetical protein
LATQGIDMTKLLVTFHGIDVAGDQLLTQGTTPITRPIQESCGRVATNLITALDQLSRQLHRFEIRPTHGIVGGAAGTVRFKHVFDRLLQPRLTFGHLRPATTGASDTLVIAARTPRMVGIVVAHGLQLANPCVDCSPTHTQHPRHVSDAAETDLQCLDRRVAAAVILWQGAVVQSHGVFVCFFITAKFVHRVTNEMRCRAPMVTPISCHFKSMPLVVKNLHKYTWLRC